MLNRKSQSGIHSSGVLAIIAAGWGNIVGANILVNRREAAEIDSEMKQE